MMKKSFVSFIGILIVVIFCFAGCDSDVTETDQAMNASIVGENTMVETNVVEKTIKAKDDNNNKLTIDSIKESLIDTEGKEIVNVTEYISDDKVEYVLIEYKETEEQGLPNRFVWYNLCTGDCYIQSVPCYIDCRRSMENTNCEYDFLSTYRDKYFKKEELITFGNKTQEVIEDMRITLNGIEFSFGPQAGTEAMFHAGTTTPPIINTSFLQEENIFIIEFESTLINENLFEKIDSIDKENYYIQSIEMVNKNDSSLAKIYLKDLTNYYSADIKKIFEYKSRLDVPIVNFVFYGEIDE